MSHHIDIHLERYLGPIAAGWKPAGGPVDVRVCLFQDQPTAGALTYSTLGLSNHELEMAQERSVRQELVMATHVRFSHHDIPNLLFHLVDSVIQHHCALLHGEVISLGYPVIPGSPCEHLYVSLPVVFPENFAVCRDTLPYTVFAWLFP